MTKAFMIGTLDDTPMRKISVNGKNYLVDVENQEVFLDDVGLPRVTDDATTQAVLKAAE